MFTDGQAITEELREEFIAELTDWMASEQLSARAAKLRLGIDVSDSTFSEILAGKYRGNADAHLRLMDQKLADELARRKRLEPEEFARIGLTEMIFGGLMVGQQLGRMPIIAVPPGGGKSSHILAFQRQRKQTFVMRIEDAPADRRVVSELLCTALSRHHGPGPLVKFVNAPHRRRVQEIKDFLGRNRGSYLIVDEAQKLSENGLEFLRDLFDWSDPSGRRPMGLAFFGDKGFLDLVKTTQSGKKTKVTSQLASRMYPVIDIEAHVNDHLGGFYYSVADIIAITRNTRLKVLSPAALKWLHMIANVGGDEGLLRRAITIFSGALLLHREKIDSGEPLGVPELEQAMSWVLGETKAAAVEERAKELQRKVAG